MPTRIALLLGHFTYSGFSLSQCSDNFRAPDRKTQRNRVLKLATTYWFSVQFRSTAT